MHITTKLSRQTSAECTEAHRNMLTLCELQAIPLQLPQADLVCYSWGQHWGLQHNNTGWRHCRASKGSPLTAKCIWLKCKKNRLCSFTWVSMTGWALVLKKWIIWTEEKQIFSDFSKFMYLFINQSKSGQGGILWGGAGLYSSCPLILFRTPMDGISRSSQVAQGLLACLVGSECHPCFLRWCGPDGFIGWVWVGPAEQYLLCGDPVGDGLLHRLPCHLSHNYIGEAVEHFTEERYQSDLKFWICERHKNTSKSEHALSKATRNRG